MLDAGRIAVILDGLDEIPHDLRPAVLRALSQQATFRLVLLARSAEMADAASQAMLHGAAAVELQDIDPATAADYLTRTQLDPPPHSWQKLTSQLRQDPGGPLAHALNSPLTLTLVRDTYRAGDDAGELLGLHDAAGHPAPSEDIAGHLLDRVLPAAYTQQPGEPPPRYDLAAAERALRRIATRMNNDGTRDLQWWRVPAWVHAVPRFIAAWFGTGLVAGLVFGLVAGLVFGLVAGLAAAFVAAVAYGRGNKIPKRIAPMQWRRLFRRRPLLVGLPTGLAGALVLGPAGGLVLGLVAGLAAGLAAWSGTGLAAIERSGSWVGLVAGLVFGLVAGLAAGLAAGLGYGLWVGLVVGLVYPQSWSSSLAFVQLAASDRTPVRLMQFLEDARGRGVLRTVGPVYQFRHARLQDRLAGRELATAQGPGDPHAAAGDAAPTAEAPPASAR